MQTIGTNALTFSIMTNRKAHKESIPPSLRVTEAKKHNHYMKASLKGSVVTFSLTEVVVGGVYSFNFVPT